MIAGLARDFTVKFSARNCMAERKWIRNDEFCEAVRDLRNRGNSWDLVRVKLRERFPHLENVRIDRHTLNRALTLGPIKFFSQNGAQS